MRRLLFFFCMILMIVLCATQAFAGVLGSVKGWLSGEVIALIATAILTIIGGAIGLLFSRLVRTFKEAGEFMATLGAALEDKKLTREEIGAIIKEGRDIFAVWEKGG